MNFEATRRLGGAKEFQNGRPDQNTLTKAGKVVNIDLFGWAAKSGPVTSRGYSWYSKRTWSCLRGAPKGRAGERRGGPHVGTGTASEFFRVAYLKPY